MGNHDVYNAPADIAQEQEGRAFQEKVRAVHKRLEAMPAGQFTVGELYRLLNMPPRIHQYAVPEYGKDDLKWLRELEAKVGRTK